MPGPAPHLAPTPLGERFVAPDAARGAMLALIALANTTGYLWSARATPALHAAAAPADLVTHAVLQITVHQRIYPMFAFLFGYGLMQFWRRVQRAPRDERAARTVLLTRQAWMIAIGAIHVVALFSGDIVSVYGLLGLVLVLTAIRAPSRALAWWSGTVLAVGTIMLVALLLGAPAQWASLLPDVATADPLQAMAERVEHWAMTIGYQAFLSFLVPAAALAGMWAGKERLLEDPVRHRRLLQQLAVWGIVLGWTTGALVVGAQLGVPLLAQAGGPLFALSMGGGVLCGIGYAALFALWAQGRTTPRALEYPLVAVGRRSLTCYLLQSVLCAPVLAAWGLGLGASLTDWSMAAYAIAVWLVTALVAVILDRAGLRGPAEWALRRLSYPRASSRRERRADSGAGSRSPERAPRRSGHPGRSNATAARPSKGRGEVS